MNRSPIDVFQFAVKPVHLWDKQWLLLTAGDFQAGKFNSMTVGWGSFGVMWNKPFALVVVRPVRYTYEFIDRYETFTLCAFSRYYKKALNILGTKSGRDGDKITEAGLTPSASHMIAAPGLNEAELSIECRKIYWDDLHPGQFLDSGIEQHYPRKDYHRIYYGEIVYVEGVEKYVGSKIGD